MQFSQKRVLFPLIAFVELIVIIYLLPATYKPDKLCESSPPEQKNIQWEPPKLHRIATDEPNCTNDNDCPNDSFCLKGECHIKNTADNETVDAGDNYSAPRPCAKPEDCGCGYQCIYDECHKLDLPNCCANADCEEGDFCQISDYNPLIGTCTASDCDSDADCDDRCGMRCVNHHCNQSYCCTDSDCTAGKFCYFREMFDGATEGYCIKSECDSDTDCSCGGGCDPKYRMCVTYRSDPPIPCCDTDFFYEGKCYARDRIEDGNCLDDKHCANNYVCVEECCLPSTCTNNEDCGCEAVCRDNHCEIGCDDNSGCCDEEYPVCDRGDCISSDTDNENE